MSKKVLSLIILFFHITIFVFAGDVDTLIVHSNAMNKDIKNVVITPKGYPKKDSAYSVIYLLHGAGGDYKTWLKVAPKLKEYSDFYNVIIVCPDGERTSCVKRTHCHCR